jgi:transposase-like protein
VTKSIFAAPHFNDEQAAYDYVEARIWANGRVCPKCGVVDRSGRLSGKTDRPGLYKCYACRKKFTVKMGTVFEDSHILMRDWLTAIHLICSSKKGVSSNQLHRTLGITLKSAWFMSHRIREAMRIGALAHPMGSDGGIVEIDETFIGKKEGAEVRRGGAHKNIVGLQGIEWVILGGQRRKIVGGHGLLETWRGAEIRHDEGWRNQAGGSGGCRMDIRSRAFGRRRWFVAYLVIRM